MDPLLSLCMIVRNEASSLRKCLESVQTLVDEMIIIDTGSTDDTKAIAQEFTNKVYDFTWIDDFAAARNESIRHATGKWILVLDADEYVQPEQHEQLKTVLSDFHIEKPSGFILPIMNITGSGFDESNRFESTGARLFTNCGNIAYTEPIHEQLTCANGLITFQHYPFTIFHEGYTSHVVQSKNKSERNLAILEKHKSEEKLKSPYFCFVLANEYANKSDWETASELYNRSYSISNPSDTWYVHLVDRLISTELKLSNFVHARSILNTALQHYGDKPDFHCVSGILNESIGLWNEALADFQKCIIITNTYLSQNKDYWLIHPTYGQILPYQMIGEIYRKLGSSEKAVDHWINCLRLQPKNIAVLIKLMELLAATEQPKIIMGILTELYSTSIPSNLILLFKAALRSFQPELSLEYARLMLASEISVTAEDNLWLRLMTKQPFNKLDLPSNYNLSSALAVTAAIIANDISIAEFGHDKATGLPLAEYSIKSLKHNPPAPLVLDETMFELIVEVLTMLHGFGYIDLYYHLIQTIGTAELINRVATEMYDKALHEPALELIESLLSYEALDAKNYKLLAQWNANLSLHGEIFQFLNQSMSVEPDIELFGRAKELLSKEQFESFCSKHRTSFSSVHHLFV